MAYHAKLSPSSAHRWARCPGSIAAQGDGGSSEYADEGTMAHEVRALCLRTGVDPQAYVGRLFNVGSEDEPRMLEWTTALADELRPDVTRVQLFLAARTASWLEVKVPIDHVTREGGATGTADLIALDLGDQTTVLYVDDLKFGRGVKVEVKENEQALLYAIGAVRFLEDLDIVPDEIVLSISQPRIDGHSEWRITIGELNAWERKLHGWAVRTYEDDAPRVPGKKQCKWCSFKAECPEAQAFAEQLAQADFTNEEAYAEALASVPRAEGERVAQMMRAADFLEDLLRAYRARGEAMLFGGIPVPGFKLVQGKMGARSWVKDSKAQVLAKAEGLKVPEDKLYAPRELLTPPQLEKSIGKKNMAPFAELITQSPGKASVAPEDDPRPAYSPAATAQEFEQHDETL